MAPHHQPLQLFPLPPPRSPLIREQKLQASRLRRTAPIFPRSSLSPAGRRRRGAAPPPPVHASRRAGEVAGKGRGAVRKRAAAEIPPSPVPNRPLAPPRRRGSELCPPCRPPPPPHRSRRAVPPSTPPLSCPASASAGRAQAHGYGPPPPPPPPARPRLRLLARLREQLPSEREQARGGTGLAAGARTGAGARAPSLRRTFWHSRPAAPRLTKARWGPGPGGGRVAVRRHGGRGHGTSRGARPRAGRGGGRPAGAVAFQRDYLAPLTLPAACDTVGGATPHREGRDYFPPQSGGGDGSCSARWRRRRRRLAWAARSTSGPPAAALGVAHLPAPWRLWGECCGAETSSRPSRRARRLNQLQGHPGTRVFIGLRCPVNWIEAKRGEGGSVMLEYRRRRQYGEVKLYLIPSVWRLKSSNLDLSPSRASRPSLSVLLGSCNGV